MKETYDIIIKKLEKDYNKFVSEINEIIEDVEVNPYIKARYDRLTGAKNYCKDLTEFFKNVRNNIK